jgi:hypothetical protein
MITTSIERLEQIELERQETMNSSSFQEWMNALRVSLCYSSPEPRLNAREMNSQYDFGKNKVARLELSRYL